MNNLTYQSNNYENEINLADIIKVLNKYKIFIILLVIMAVLFTFFSTMRMPKQYQATATILPLESTNGMNSLMNKFSFAAFGFGRGDSQGGIFSTLLKTRSLAKNVIEEMDLLKIIYKNKWDKKNNNWINGFSPSIDTQATSLSSSITVKSGFGGALEITVVNSDPKLASDIANTYVEQLGVYIIQNSLNISFKKLDPAIPPQKPFSPNIKKNVISSAVVSFVVGCVLSFLLNYFREIQKK